MNEKPIENRGEIILYRAEDNTIQLDVRMENETVWLTAAQMALLFGRDVKTIRKHINNALREELADEVVGAKFASTTQHGTQAVYLVMKKAFSQTWMENTLNFLVCAKFATPKKLPMVSKMETVQTIQI